MPRFLISRLSALGDVVCTLPVASSLKRAFPDAHITWIVDPRFAGIVECCASVDEIIKAKPGFNPKTWPKTEGKFDAALDMQGLMKSAIPIWRAKSKEKLGYHWQREGSWLFSSKVLPDPTSFHIVDQYIDVARVLGGKDDAQFDLKPKEEDIANVKAKVGAENYVVMNPGAGWVTKRWPPAHFAKVIDRLAEQNIPAVLIGGPAQPDRDAAQEVEQEAKTKPVNLVGQTSVRELVALIHGAQAHLGGDTGSTHIAAALARPAIALYSLTFPQRSCPYGQVQNCFHDSRGLSHIAPDPVFEKLMDVFR